MRKKTIRAAADPAIETDAAPEQEPAAQGKHARTRVHVPGYLSIEQAAHMMGMSERSIYGYIKQGRLPGTRIGQITLVHTQEIQGFQRRAPGRIRATTPHWRTPPPQNKLYVTTITARVRPGQGEQFERRLRAMRESRHHTFPGTAARSIVQNQQDPAEIVLTLVWRSAVMPSEEERQGALDALCADLADVLEWETATYKEGQALLHA